MNMPAYLTDANFWASIWPLLFFPLLVAFILSMCVASPIENPARFRLFVLISFSLSLLGMVTGNLTGLSRDSSVGSVLPAVLGLVGGMAVYVFGKEGRLAQYTVSLGLVAMTINLIVGVYWGSRTRILYEFETQVRGPEFMRPAELARVDTDLAVAIQNMRNEAKFKILKAAMEKQYGFRLEITFEKRDSIRSMQPTQ